MRKTYWDAVAEALAAKLDDPNIGVRDSVAIAIGTIGNEAASAVPALMRALGSERVDDKVHLGKALSRIGPAARPALPVLLESLESPDAGTRRGASEAIVSVILPTDQRTLPKLIESLMKPTISKHRLVRKNLIRAVFVINGGDTAAASTFLSRSKSPRPEVRMAAVCALSSMTEYVSSNLPSEVERRADDWLATLMDALHDEVVEIRIQASMGIVHFGPNAKPAVPILEQGMSDPQLAETYKKTLERIAPTK